MATESPKERSDEAAAVTSSPKLTPKVDSDSQNASLDRPQVNGGGGGGSSSGDRDTDAAPSPAAGPSPDELENKHLSDIVDDLVNSAEVSVSGGSDNEAAKSDASKTKDSKGRVASTTKKPTSFKAINVNKMFLATKATSASSGQTKTAEKSPSLASATPASSGTTTTSRPRLVAKTGGGLITKGSANGAKSAPDPSAVWNKNRPAPPPEPKKYTDEELRKYGIHMASRLQTSDSKGQSNWADIEDDDDDWGPETITWKDGTKVQIAHVDSHSKTEPAAADKDKEDKADADKNKTTTTAAAAATATTTASKPGTLGSGKGLVLKSGTSEKPTLVAKPPPAPAPTKSPWAPLPKIEKVSPVAPEAAATEIGPKASPKIPPAHPSPGLRPGPGPQQPPREIAADDFSRAPWRDGPGGGNRELYNSHSGRYEPYDRRGPMRGEPPYGRQPSLMQRPPHHEPHGPMDQGGPFSGRNHEQPGPYGHRRSSNTSTGSGSWQRPTLKSLEHPPPPPELIARRTSTAGGSEGPISPRMPPAGYHGGPRHGQPWQPRTSPGTTHATPSQQPPQAHQPQQPHQQPPPPPGPDNRGLPPPLHPSPGAPPAVVITEDDIELQKRLMRERRELALKRRQEEEAREEAAKRERIRLKLQALGFPPDEPGNSKKAEKEKEAAASTPTQIQSRNNKSSDKSTAPKEEGEPKVAETPAAGAPTETTGGASDANLQKPQQQQQQQTPTPQPTTSTTPRLPHSDRVSEHQQQQQQQQQQGQSQSVQAAAQSSTAQHGQGQGQGQGQPTQNHPWAPPSRQSDRHAPPPPPVWGPQPSSKNVWAPPNHNRSLGNGTFSSDIGPIAPPNMTSTNVPRQPPIGPPRQPQRQLAENPWTAAVRESDRKYDDMLKAQYDERDRRLKAEGRSASDLQPAIKDTWRPTKLDASGVRVTAAPKQTVQIGQDNPWAASTEAKTAVQNGPSTGAAPDYGQLAQGPVQPARGGSRFFPARQENRDVRPEPAPEPIPQPVVEPILRRDSPSPPPPDMAGHPAFDGDASHPHVSLPPPHPVVRLPPTTTTTTTATTTSTQKSTTESNRGSSDVPKSPKVDSRPHGAPSFAWAAQAPYKEPERGPAAAKTDSVWQQKIDNLLGVRKGPNRSGADHAPPPPAAQPEPSVPAPSVQPPADLSLSITTKVMDEECFEEQEMGSVPPIRLPKTVPEMAWQPSPSPKPLSKKFFPVVVSADPISFPPDLSGSGPVWRVRLPGGEAKLITVPFGRTRSNPRRSGPRNNRHGPSGQHRPKGREPSAAFSGEQGSGTTGSHGRGHRGGYRSRDNWSRNNGNAQTQT